MTLQASQKKTGHLQEESANPGTNKGPDGDEGAQKKVGHLDEESGPKGGASSGEDGFRETQGKTGFSQVDSKNTGDMSVVEKVDYTKPL